MRKLAKLTSTILICSLCLLLVNGCSAKMNVNDANDANNVLAVTDETNSILTESEKSTFSKEVLEQDFEQFIGIIENAHPQLYTDKEALSALISLKRSEIKDGMTELDFYRLLSPIATLLKCGHTNVSLSSDTENALFQEPVMFPLALHWVDERAFVSQNVFAESIPIGSEILRINGKPIEEIYSLLMANFSADGKNITRKEYFLNNIFNYFYTLIVEASSTFEVVYNETPEAPLNSEKFVTIKGVTSAEYNERILSDWTSSETPYKAEFYDNYAVITFYSFYPQGAFTLSNYKTFMDDFFIKIRDEDIQKVILDVRENSGGDPNVTSHLFSYLAKSEQPYFVDRGVGFYRTLYNNVPLAENNFSGKLAILMDGMSFSSTGHLLALLKYQKIGTYFGEESGGSFACTDATQNFKLNNSKIQFYCSTIIWEVKVEGLTPGRGILPDYPISQTLEQYLSNEDVVLTFAVDWINE